jgi:hypothetical protein
MRDAVITAALALVLCAFSGCSKRTGTGGPAGAVSASVEQQAEPAGFQYPIARWRLAMFEELDRTPLWIGHIAIRHSQSQPEAFRPFGWSPDSPPPNRSVAEAWALAEKVAALAAAAPNDFEELARKYSEDLVSKDDGGMLGGVRASQLVSSGFLDVLAALKPGEVSKPFRTPYGFQILKRYAPPPEEKVAGERIVIGYRSAVSLAVEPQRSRAEALLLAKDVAEQALKGAQDFGTLVERYSESADKSQHGDIGVYSTRDPGYMPVEVQRLARLKVGEVTGPIDGPAGFEILRRVPVTPRTEYAMAMIELGFELDPAAREASQASALGKAEAMRRVLEAEPERFEEFQTNHCCERIDRWTRGRGDPTLADALDAIPVGTIAERPLLFKDRYLLVKRLDPSALPPEKPRLSELPNPSEPDYEALLRHNTPKNIAGATRSLVKALEQSSELTPDTTRSISETLGQLATSLEQNLEDRANARTNVRSTLAALESRLSAEQFGVFKRFASRWYVRRMMPQGSVP